MTPIEIDESTLQRSATRWRQRQRADQAPADAHTAPADAPFADSLQSRESKKAEAIRLVERAPEPVPIQCLGEVEERPGYGRGRYAVPLGAFVLPKEALVQADGSPAGPALRGGDVDGVASADETPQGGGASMAEEGVIPVREHRCHPVTTLIYAPPANGIDTTVNDVEAAGLKPSLDRIGAEAEIHQLPARHDPVLAVCERRDLSLA